MSEIETKYKGHTLVYTTSWPDKVEVWCCRALDLEHASLGRLKEMINKWDVATRKIGGVAVIRLGRYNREGFSQLTANTIADDDSVWCTHPKARTRSKESCDDLVLDSATNRAMLEEVSRLRREAERLTEKADKMQEALKRVKMEDLRAIAADRLDREGAE